jgi:predicted nuclease of predicted toxin-antitoxin system
VRFLIDAHLPRRLAHRLRDAGHDALHTLDLPAGNRTTDEEINELSVRDQRVVVTKDADFVNSFVLSSRPGKLLLISTGNISNPEMEALLSSNLERLIEALESADYVEMSRSAITVHG